MSEETLTSLAILTVNWDHGHDLIESFVPIVAECIRRDGDRPVALVDLQRAVEKEAGISDTTYMAVAHDGPRVLTPGGTAGNTFATNIAVLPGDIVGVNSGNAGTTFNACMFQVFGQPYLFRTPGLADGTSESFNSFTGYRPNVSATFEPAALEPSSTKPSNAFTLGGITRNKKKGTATLTVNIPNPGELTGSGRGVKVASAAVSSKTVAAGTVKLTVKAKGKKKRKLNETGKVKLKVAITYTPTGGDPSTQSRKVKLKKR